jgi:hypothetical protein
VPSLEYIAGGYAWCLMFAGIKRICCDFDRYKKIYVEKHLKKFATYIKEHYICS